MNKHLTRASILAIATATPALAQTPAAAADPQPSAGTTPSPSPDVIIVTGTPLNVETPTIVAKVNRRSIVETGGSSVADALAAVPGISDTSFASGASRPIIRGQDAARVRILEDGTSSSDVSDVGPDHGIPVDPLSAQSIEVVRGAGTLRYGSQAIGGVVNIINNRVPLTLPANPVSGEVDGSYNTVNDAWEGAAMIDARAGNVALHADAFARHTDDYDTPLGTQENSYFRGHGANAGASLFFGPDDASRIGAAIEQYNSNYGIPSDTTHIVMQQTKYMTRSSFALGPDLFRTLNVDASYANYKHDEVEPDGTVDTTFRNKEFDGHAELLLGPISVIQSSALGVEIQHREFSAVGEDASYLFPTTTDSQAGYLFTDTPLGQAFHLQVAGRLEHVRVEGTPASDIHTTRNFTPISGSIGGLYDVGKAVKFGLTLSSTSRAPLITELFARGGHDGPNTYETGDPDLHLERANSVEATLRVVQNRFRFEGSLYSSWFRNYIYGQLTGRTCDDDGVCSVGGDGDLKELFYEQQGAWFRGAEAEAHFALIKGENHTFELRGLGDYTRATFSHGGNVPRIPPYRIGGGIHYASPMVDAGLLLIHAGRQDKFGLFDTPTPSYNQLTGQVAWRPFKAHPGIEFAVVGQNLTNDVQRNAAALNKDDVVLPGRNIRFVVRAATF